MPKGTGVSGGVGFAQVLVWKAQDKDSAFQPHTETPEQEIRRFESALRSLTAKNDSVRQKTARRFGDNEAAIFDAYHMMLSDDVGLLQPVRALIAEEKYSAEYAVTTQFNSLAAQFLELESEYMRQRAEDIYSLRDQLLREMAGAPVVSAAHLDAPTIVVAHALGPADIANIDLSRLEGIVCETGGYSSHTAIIARTMGIPAVLGVFELLSQVQDGDIMALDGESGEVWINPNRTEIRYLRERSDLLVKRRQLAQLYRGLPTITTDGHRVELATNTGQLEEVDIAVKSDAEAIGMHRTELLHNNRMPMASEEEQFLTFRHILDKISGKPVSVRVFDDGGNLPVIAIKGSTEEANPVLGFRGIRMNLGRRNFFETQLRALLRASAYGELKILLPMISTVEELDASLEILEKEKAQLRSDNQPFEESIPVGVLVETPSAALMARELAQKCDFFSIGISDFLQFVLAIDRNNTHLSYLYHAFHPSVLRLVKKVIEAAHDAGIPCYICGDVPQYHQILPLFLGLGADGFSVNPNLILPSRQVLNSCNYVECFRMAQKALECQTSAEVQQCVEDMLPNATHPPDEPSSTTNT